VLNAADAPGGPVLLMIPGLFLLIPGDLLCAATAEIAVGQFTPGAVRLAQAAVTLIQLAAGVMIAAELTGVGVRALVAAHGAWGVQELVLAHSLVVPQEGETGATGAVFIAATVLAFGVGALELFPGLPPRGVTILAGFFALTVGAVALRGLTSLAGNPTAQAFNDIRDATSETVALTLGLIAGAVPAVAIGAYRRRSGRASPAG
jgi:uncharacterized membrane protein YjjB (DUF3815 family)